MKAPNGVAVSGVTRGNVQKDLARRCGSTNEGSEQRYAIVYGVNAEPDIEQKAQADSDEPGPLQQAERAGQFTQGHLFDKGTTEDGCDQGQGQGV